MKRTLLATALLAVAVPAGAQQDFQDVSFTLGLQQKYFDTNSSKFLEYRDLPQGAVLPAMRLKGQNGDFRYDLQARDVTQGDQQYRLKLENDHLRLTGAYTGVPHNFGGERPRFWRMTGRRGLLELRMDARRGISNIGAAGCPELLDLL